MEGAWGIVIHRFGSVWTVQWSINTIPSFADNPHMPHTSVKQTGKISVYRGRRSFWSLEAAPRGLRLFIHKHLTTSWRGGGRCEAWKSIWLQNLLLETELFFRTRLDKAATLIDLYTGFHTAEQHWQPQGHTSIRDLGEFKHCRSTLAQRRLPRSLSLSRSSLAHSPTPLSLSPHIGAQHSLSVSKSCSL